MARRSDMSVPEQPVQSPVDENSTATAISPEAAKTAKAERVIQDHVLIALASGFIPGPGLDMAAAFTAQLTMLKRLAAVYDVPFRPDVAKGVVASLFGTLGGAGAAAIVGGSFVKTIPIIGTAVGLLGTPVSFGAFTYAVGKVFERHFELGGTFVDLDPKNYREYFREMRRRGRDIAQVGSADVTAAQSKGSGDSARAAATEA
jgi:uncharacterized protein (DUF697 family)